MKRLIAVVVLAMLLAAAPCFGAVGISKDGVHEGTAMDIDISRGNSSFDGSTVTIYGSGMSGGVTAPVSAKVTNLTGTDFLSFGVINLGDIGALNETGGTVRSIALADGTPGQMITVTLAAATGGTLYITDDQVASGYTTKTGWDDAAMNAALDSVTFLYVDDTTGWVIIGTNSVTVT
jgi:hypothetical protein